MLSSLPIRNELPFKSSSSDSALKPFQLPSIFDLAPSQSFKSEELTGLIQSCQRGLASGHKPNLIEDGLGGTYFLESASGSKLAVFKPFDEDPYSLNNPKNKGKDLELDGSSIDNSPLPRGLQPGIAVFRECAAWWLDQCSSGFVGIPPTSLVALRESFDHSPCSPFLGDAEAGCSPVSSPVQRNKQKGIDYCDFKGVSTPTPCSSPATSPPGSRLPIPLSPKQDASPNSSALGRVRLGSLQKWMEHDYQSWDVGFSLFPVAQVHRIGVFDIRVLNADRHGGNLLVKETRNSWGEVSSFDLIPIDHSFILPSTLNEAYFEWLHWPQAKVPFDASIKEYVASLDWRADVQLLKDKMQSIEEGFSFCEANIVHSVFTEHHFRVLRIMTTFLQKTVAAGCSLYEIASLISRDDTNSNDSSKTGAHCSILEDFCSKALQKTFSGPNQDLEKWTPENPIQEEKFFEQLEFLIDEYLLCFFPLSSPRKP
jgi:hypothetical protein